MNIYKNIQIYTDKHFMIIYFDTASVPFKVLDEALCGHPTPFKGLGVHIMIDGLTETRMAISDRIQSTLLGNDLSGGKNANTQEGGGEIELFDSLVTYGQIDF